MHNIYKERGYESREDYLNSLADEYGVDWQLAHAAADLLGPNEDFDGLINMLEEL